MSQPNARLILDVSVARNGRLVTEGMIIRHGVFAEIKPNAMGRRRFILVSKKSIPLNTLSVAGEDVMVQSSVFKHYYLRLGESIVGSMLDVSAHNCVFNNYAVIYSRRGELKDFNCPTEYQSGGLLIYQDGHGSFAAIPAKELENELVVKDRAD